MDYRLKLKSKTRKLLKENIWENLFEFRLSKDFLDMTTKTKSLREQVDKLDFICLVRWLKDIILWFLLYKFLHCFDLLEETAQALNQAHLWFTYWFYACVRAQSLSCIWLFVTPWPIQSMEFSRSEYWSGWPFLSPGIFPTQESNPGLSHCRWILYQLSYKGCPRI